MIWSFIVLSYSTLFLLGLADNLRGPLLPELIHYFGLNNTQGSLIFALSSVFGFLASLSSAPVMKFLGLNKSLLLSVIVLGLGYFVVGIAPTYFVLLLGISVFGYSMGLLGVVQNIMASLSGPEKYRSQILAGLHSMYGLASLLAPLVVTWSYDYLSGWRSAFFSVSAFALTILLASLFFLRNSTLPQTHSHVSHSEDEPLSLQWLAGFVLAAYVVAEILVSSRLAQFVREFHNATLQESSSYLSWFFVLLLSGRLLFTVIPLKVSRAKVLQLSLLLSIVCCILGINWHPYFLVASGLTMSVFYPFAITYISERFKVSSFSAIAKAVTLQGLFVIFMHIGVGYLTDVLGLQKALYFGVVFLILAGLSLYFCERKFLGKIAK